jgi:putative addiction module component (TIGR02574 family)
MSGEIKELLKLGRAERIQLVEDLWDSIADESPEIPLSAEKTEELQRRKEWFQRHPDAGVSWEEVKQKARASRG